VDLTLVDLHSGVEVPMGTPFDTFGDAATPPTPRAW
jgi:D-alanyl-D-alanine dipeptidase